MMNQHTLFQCPLCFDPLKEGERNYYCAQGHSFDIARQGHVNLLLPRHTGSGNPGDSREMLQSRRDFLDAGYYRDFSDRLNGTVLDCLHQGSGVTAVLDAGCGEGYYTRRLQSSFHAVNRRLELYGVDVSKRGVQYAAGRAKGIRYAVASSYHLPILPESMDCVLCVFAPRDEAEFARVLKNEGVLVVAAPGPLHLFSLRKLIYADPEAIGQKGDVSQGFTLLDRINVAYSMELTNTRDILNLLAMTPYSKHISEDSMAELKKLPRLETEVDFNILVYEKNRS